MTALGNLYLLKVTELGHKEFNLKWTAPQQYIKGQRDDLETVVEIMVKQCTRKPRKLTLNESNCSSQEKGQKTITCMIGQLVNRILKTMWPLPNSGVSDGPEGTEIFLTITPCSKMSYRDP